MIIKKLMDLVPMSKGKRQKAGEKELQVSAKGQQPR